MTDVQGDHGLRFTPDEQAWLAWAEGQAPPRNNGQPAFPAVPPGAVLLIASLLLMILFGIFHACTRSSAVRQDQRPATTASALPTEPPLNLTGIARPASLGDIRFAWTPVIYSPPPPLPPLETPELPIQTATVSDQIVVRSDQTVPCKDFQNVAERPAAFERPYQNTDEPVPIGPVFGPTIAIEVSSETEPPTDPPVKKHGSFLGKLNPFRYVGRAVRKVLKPFRSHNRAEQDLRELPGNQSEESRRQP